MFQKETFKKFLEKNNFLTLTWNNNIIRLSDMQSGILLENKISEILVNKIYTENTNSIEYELKEISKLIKPILPKSIWKPQIFMSSPPMHDDSFIKNMTYLVQELMCREVYYVDEFLAMLIGSGDAEITNLNGKKLISIYSTNQKTFFGFFFGGAIFSLSSIEKTYNDLNPSEITMKIEEIHSSKMPFPEMFHKLKGKLYDHWYSSWQNHTISSYIPAFIPTIPHKENLYSDKYKIIFHPEYDLLPTIGLKRYGVAITKRSLYF